MVEFKRELVNWLRRTAPDISMVTDHMAEEGFVMDLFFPALHAAIVLYSIHDPDIENLAKIHKVLKVRGIRIIHLWEDVWIFEKTKVQSRLISLLGKSHKIHGRATTIEAIDNRALVAFLDENHLNVPIKAKYKYGLFFKGGMVAVMSFSKSREILREGIMYNSHELLRFCNKLNMTVVGGMTRLLRHFISAQKPDDIMTYADRDWSDGKVYQKAGFELTGTTPPMEFWLNTKTGKREYPKYALRQMGEGTEILVSGEDADEFMKKHRFIRVYNAGSYKYIMKLKGG